MKRKLLMALLSLVCALCLAVGLTACNDDGGTDADNEQNSEQIGGGSGDETEIETPAEIESLEYTLLDDNTYEVSGIGTCTDTEIVIPSTYNNLPVTSIGYTAFIGCSSITSVTVSSGVTSIGILAFYNCTSLASITLPDTIFSIGQKPLENTAYYNDSNNWENGELYIGNYLIAADTSVTGNYTIKEGTTVVADSAFVLCSFDSMTIPASVINLGNSLGRKVTSYNVDAGNTVYKSIDGNLYNYHGTELILYATGKTESSFTVPDIVTSIGGGAFSGCSLSSITLPDGLSYIGDGAISNCLSLTDINIPDTVTIIGRQAFSGTPIQSITIPSSVTVIGSLAFIDCPLLTSVTFENTSGWYVTETEGATSGMTVYSSDLSYASTAAAFLTGAYCGYYWYRSES